MFVTEAIKLNCLEDKMLDIFLYFLILNAFQFLNDMNYYRAVVKFHHLSDQFWVLVEKIKHSYYKNEVLSKFNFVQEIVLSFDNESLISC